MRLPPMPSVAELVRLYKLRAKKNLSQNFLLDMNLTHKIVHKAGNLRDHYVLEVGPGPGGITRAILEAGARELHVVEKDKRFLPGLQLLDDASNGRVRIHQGDIMTFSCDSMQLDGSVVARSWEDDQLPPLSIIGNLPFNVSTPLIIKWLRAMAAREDAWRYGRVPLTLTFQYEVAERMVAPPSDEQRCRLSVICQYLCDVTHTFTIPGAAFVPAPEVDVGVVRFVPRVTPLIDLPFPLVDKVVRHVFQYRRKYIKRGIHTLFPPEEPQLTAEMLLLSGVSANARCFHLCMEEVSALCHAYHTLCQRQPELATYDFRSKENARVWAHTSREIFV